MEVAMIVSHKHKFIFIKTKKTAGTSLEIALSGICGPDDIITPITREDELVREKLGYRGPQNYRNGNSNYFNHIPAIIVRNALGETIWREYFKFCFERNPWDKVVSWYYWEIAQGGQIPFDDFIKSGNFALVGGPGGFNQYTDDEQKIILDKVYLYEDMQSALFDLAARLNIAAIPKLPKAKSTYRKNRKPYADMYSELNKNILQKAFQREIDLFNYRFQV